MFVFGVAVEAFYFTHESTLMKTYLKHTPNCSGPSFFCGTHSIQNCSGPSFFFLGHTVSKMLTQSFQKQPQCKLFFSFLVLLLKQFLPHSRIYINENLFKTYSTLLRTFFFLGHTVFKMWTQSIRKQSQQIVCHVSNPRFSMFLSNQMKSRKWIPKKVFFFLSFFKHRALCSNHDFQEKSTFAKVSFFWDSWCNPKCEHSCFHLKKLKNSRRIVCQK